MLGAVIGIAGSSDAERNTLDLPMRNMLGPVKAPMQDLPMGLLPSPEAGQIRHDVVGAMSPFFQGQGCLVRYQ